jgi:hypothetical protein
MPLSQVSVKNSSKNSLERLNKNSQELLREIKASSLKLSTKETVIQKTIKSQRGTLAMKNSWA